MCPDCELNFKKFEEATNHDAKIMLKSKQKEQVLLRASRPSDVSFWKLLLITIFTGFFGGHYYYVGRTKKGLFFTFFFFVGIINALISVFAKVDLKGDLWEVFYFLVLVWGVVIALWIIDIANVCLNKFKIPVSRLK